MGARRSSSLISRSAFTCAMAQVPASTVRVREVVEDSIVKTCKGLVMATLDAGSGDGVLQIDGIDLPQRWATNSPNSSKRHARMFHEPCGYSGFGHSRFAHEGRCIGWTCVKRAAPPPGEKENTAWPFTERITSSFG